MKRSIIGAILAAATVAAVLAVGPGGMATATPDQESEVCYEQVPYTVYQFSKTVETETFKTQYEIDKYVRDRTRTYTEATDGVHYSWTGGRKTVDNPPPLESDKWQANAKKEPGGHLNSAIWPFADSRHYTYNSDEAASWFKFDEGTPESYGDWTEWSTPTRWEPIGSHLAWVDEVPAANWQKHGNVDTKTYQRQWSVYPTGETKKVSTGFEKSTVFYNDGDVSETNLAVEGNPKLGWTTDQDLDSSWKIFDTDEFMKNGEQIPCSTPPVYLPVQAFPTYTYQEPDCDAEGSFELIPGVGYKWVDNKNGTFTAVVESGYFFDPFLKTTVGPFDLTQPENCDGVESKPPVVTPPTVAPPAVLPPVVAPPAAQVPTAGAPTRLPSTGSSSWVLALIALVTLLGGTGLVRLSRRPTD